jgi:hypothetical protein
VDGFHWNEWSLSSGISGQLGMEWVDDLDRNTHSVKRAMKALFLSMFYL